MSIAQLQRHLVDSITVESYTGHDAFGDPTYGAPVSYSAKIEGTSRVFAQPEGVEAQSRRKIHVDTGQGAGAYVIDPRDRITLPAQFWPEGFGSAKALEVKIVSGPTGVDHLVVYV